MELVEVSVETNRSEKMEVMQLVVMSLLWTGRAKNQENGLEPGICETPVWLKN